MSVIDLDWNFVLDFEEIEKACYQNFEQNILRIHEKCMEALEDGFKMQRIAYNGTVGANHDDELRILIDKNKQLRNEIDVKLEDIKRQQTKYESYKKDQKLLSQEVKETHEAFLMAKKCYKKFLKLYFCIEKRNKEDQIIFVQFFTEAKKDSENYSVRFIRNTKSCKYELLNTTPKLDSHKELERRLNETNDVPDLLCTIRQAFLDIKRK